MTLVVLAVLAWLAGWGVNVALTRSALMARPGGRVLPPLDSQTPCPSPKLVKAVRCQFSTIAAHV